MLELGVLFVALIGILVVGLYVKGTFTSMVSRTPQKVRNDVIPLVEEVRGRGDGEEDSAAEGEDLFAQQLHKKGKTSPRCDEDDDTTYSFTTALSTAANTSFYLSHGHNDTNGQGYEEDAVDAPTGENDDQKLLPQRKKFDRLSLLRARNNSIKQDKPESLVKALDESRNNAEMKTLSRKASVSSNSSLQDRRERDRDRGDRDRGDRDRDRGERDGYRRRSSSTRSSRTFSIPMPTGPIAPLAHSNDGWKKVNKEVLSIDAKVQKEVQAILNKLCPERFDVLSDQLASIDYKQPMVMKVVVDLMFETALSNPFFSASYAELAVCLSARWPSFMLDNERCDFKEELLGRCQRFFDERGAVDMEGSDEVSEEDLEAKKSKRRARSINNVHFLGRLFCSQLVTDDIMHTSIRDMLDSALADEDEQEMEALCKLLTTVGKDLDKGKSRPFVTEYINALNELASRDIASRFKFMLMDLADLRTNRWKPRRQTASPKKLDDIRNEHNRAFRPPSLRLGPSSSFTPSMPVPKTRRAQSQTPPFPPSMRPAATPLTPLQGPAHAPRFNEHASGTFTAPSSPVNRPARPKVDVPETDLGNRGRSFTIGDMRGLASPWNGSERSDFDDSDFGDSPMIHPITSPLPTPPTSPSQMSQRDRISRLLKNFFHTKSHETVLEELVKSSLCKISCTDFVYRGLSMAFDKKDPDRAEFCILLGKLSSEKLIGPDQVREGAVRALEDLEDLVIDVPHCPVYAGDFLAASLLGDVLDICTVSEILDAVSDHNQEIGLSVSKQLVKQLKEAKGEQGALDLMKELHGTVADLL